MNKMITGVLLLAVVALGWAADHYYGKAMDWRDKYRTAYSTTQQQADTIATMNDRQRSLAVLDAKHTKELADAKNQIRALERDVAAGRKRLQLNARCPAMPAGKPSGTTGMDDAASPRLTDAAQRNYFTLRKRIETSNKMILGMQDYIRTQCLTPQATASQ
ncbi:lysis protein [Cronobacter sakazakii]|nr:lysis protein [Cronobacter sakazakii]TWR32371.1 lysis protein [Cronobacter sakazakii]